MPPQNLSARFLEPGDVLACFGGDRVSRAISALTAWPFAPSRLRIGPSHVAIVAETPAGTSPDLLWCESTTLCPHPCAVTGIARNGVQAHWPRDRVGDYHRSGGHVDVYRLTAIDALNDSESRRLSSILIDQFIRPQRDYDVAGALISGTPVVRLLDGLLLRRFRSLHDVFCSELVAAALMRLCRLNRANPTRYSPAKLLRQIVNQGTYRYVGTLIHDPLRVFEGSR